MSDRVDLEEPQVGDFQLPRAPGGGPVIQEPLWRIRLRLLRKALRRNWALFAKNKIGLVGLGIIIVFALAALAHPILMDRVWDPAIYDPVRGYDAPRTEYLVVENGAVEDPTSEIDHATARLKTTPFVEVGETISIPSQPAPPSDSHWLGTDPLGRDILSQLMYSTRAAFFLGAIAAVVTVLIATTVGSIAAYFGGWIDSLLMRFADLVLLVPLIPILIVISSLFTLTLPLLGVLIGILSGFGGTA
ncbi:MAG: hypothetical protein WD652_02120, partial [Acidimicrobiia bacterium]